MAINPNAHDIDPFARALPGQSLTEDPNSAPYLKPPATASIEKATEAILQGMHDPIRKESLLRILETDLSAETIASSIVMQAFANGMITPDMAELVKPVIVLSLLGMASDENMENIRVFNKPTTMPVSYDKISEITSKLDKGRDVEDVEDEEDIMEEPEQEELNDMPEGFIQRERV